MSERNFTARVRGYRIDGIGERTRVGFYVNRIDSLEYNGVWRKREQMKPSLLDYLGEMLHREDVQWEFS